jgi:hypothetical protein
MTGKAVFDHAIVLMDSKGDQDISDYENRAIELINGLQGELYPYSRLYNPAIPDPVFLTQLSDTFTSLDDTLAYTILAHGLAAYLLMDENPSSANTLLQRYQDLLAARMRGIGNPVHGSVDIEDVEGTDNWFNRFTRWD